MATIKANIFWNVIRVTSNLLFPLITFPYASRILGPTSIGLFNYSFSIASYFTLFATFGFPIYGTREVAVTKGKPELFNSSVNSIFSANLLTTLLATIVYALTCSFFAGENKALFLVVGCSIFLSTFAFEWFYQGIEDFKYLTVRGIIIKSISILCLFLFVKSSKDLLIYAIITVAATCGNNLLNLFRLRKYIKLRITLEKIWHHTRKASILFMGTVAISFYSYMNNILVGLFDNMEGVGFFSTGNRIVHIALSIIGVVTVSIIPRISNLIQNKQKEEALYLQRQAISLLLYFGIPASIGLIILAKPVMLLFAGDKFLPATIVLQILAALLFIIPLSSFWGHQVLIPHRKEKYGNYAVISGAVVNLVLVPLLVPRFSFAGVAISLLVAEFVVTLIHFVLGWKFADLNPIDFIPVKCIVSSVVMGIVVFVLFNVNQNPFVSIGWAAIGLLVYFITLWLLRDSFFKSMVLNKLLRR